MNTSSAAPTFVRRCAVACAGLALAAAATSSTAFAQSTSACQFDLGFKTLHDLIPAEIGGCTGDVAYATDGSASQDTVKGQLVWRKKDNWIGFTNGYTTWLYGPNGLVSRLNSQRYSWEPDYGAAGTTELPPSLAPNGLGWTILFDHNLALPDVQVDDGTGHTTPLPAKGKWLNVYFWARNNQPRPAGLTVDDVSLVDKQGRKYVSDFDLRQVTGPGAEAPFVNPISPGSLVLLRITLDVGKDATDGVMHVARGNDIAAL